MYVACIGTEEDNRHINKNLILVTGLGFVFRCFGWRELDGFRPLAGNRARRQRQDDARDQ